MDPSVASALLQAFTAGAACIAAYATGQVIVSGRRRGASRGSLGRVIDAGNVLLDDYRQDRGSREELDARYESWEDDAIRAVDRADRALHSRYHLAIPGQFSQEQTIEERIRRLHDIQDRL